MMSMAATRSAAFCHGSEILVPLGALTPSRILEHVLFIGTRFTPLGPHAMQAVLPTPVPPTLSPGIGPDPAIQIPLSLQPALRFNVLGPVEPPAVEPPAVEPLAVEPPLGPPAPDSLLAKLIAAFQRRYDVDSLDNRREDRVRQVVDGLVPILQRYFKASVRGLERIPEGAGIYVGNHNGGSLTPDSYLLGAALYHRGGLDDLPFAMAHDMVVSWPLLRDFFVPLGAVRACPENARRICAAGKKLLIYPGGDAEAMRAFRDRNRIMFGQRRGYVRLAVREGVPIIPAVAHGAHSTAIILDDGKWIVEKLGLDRALRLKAWPITLSIPWGLTIGPPPVYFPLPSRITIEVLDPIHFERAGAEAAADASYVETCHRQVVEAMQAALDRLERRARRLRERSGRLF